MLEGLNSITGVASAQKEGLLGSLGIDVQLLVLQTIAFLILLAVLSKFVFPVLGRMLEKREKLIEDSVKAARDADKNARESEEKISKLIAGAQKEASEIVASAREQAEILASETDKRAKERAETIMSTAQADIAKEIEKARTTLRNEVIDLVALATERVASKAVSKEIDSKVIAASIEEVSRK